MKLTIRKSDNLADWYLIERAEHDGRTWLERVEGGLAMRASARFSDADVEGTAEEMRDVADAIQRGTYAEHVRCAVDARGDLVLFHSPRNSQTRGIVDHVEAVALAVEIRALLGSR